LISAWIYRQNRAGVPPLIEYEEDVFEDRLLDRVKAAALPETLSEKQEAFLLHLADLVGVRYAQSVAFTPKALAAIAAHNNEELLHIGDLLQELGYVQRKSTGSERAWKLTAAGWKRVEELHRTPESSDTAFVAMWFSDVTAAYRKSIEKAIRHCGYRVSVAKVASCRPW
jgi:hypothetical protein